MQMIEEIYTDVDLYDATVKVSWVSRLRDVMKFPDSNALTTQLNKDLTDAQYALTALLGPASH